MVRILNFKFDSTIIMLFISCKLLKKKKKNRNHSHGFPDDIHKPQDGSINDEIEPSCVWTTLGKASPRPTCYPWALQRSSFPHPTLPPKKKKKSIWQDLGVWIMNTYFWKDIIFHTTNKYILIDRFSLQ